VTTCTKIRVITLQTRQARRKFSVPPVLPPFEPAAGHLVEATTPHGEDPFGYRSKESTHRASFAHCTLVYTSRPVPCTKMPRGSHLTSASVYCAYANGFCMTIASGSGRLMTTSCASALFAWMMRFSAKGPVLSITQDAGSCCFSFCCCCCCCCCCWLAGAGVTTRFVSPACDWSSHYRLSQRVLLRPPRPLPPPPAPAASTWWRLGQRPHRRGYC